MEEAALANGGVRIKFATIFEAGLVFLSEEMKVGAMALADALEEVEKEGAAPVAPDGKVGGNGAMYFPGVGLLVSKSGKQAGVRMTFDDFVLVTDFDERGWGATYRATNKSVRPSSDTPLLWAALANDLVIDGGVSKGRVVGLHGHALATVEDAARIDAPISHAETMFSTREDVDALVLLMKEHPIAPVLLRRGHGFFILAATVGETRTLFQSRIVPYMHSETKRASKL
jgi:hypothetical protein